MRTKATFAVFVILFCVIPVLTVAQVYIVTGHRDFAHRQRERRRRD